MSIGSAFSAFFSLLSGKFPEAIARQYGFIKVTEVPKPVVAPPPAPLVKTSDGALQLLGILQRDARLVDFLMEDISAYSDDQVGAAVRSLHESCRATLDRYVKLSPVVDSVEGTFTKIDSGLASKVKLIGNVPANGKASGGTLRHKGWRVEKVDLPKVGGSEELSIIAPAEIEIE